MPSVEKGCHGGAKGCHGGVKGYHNGGRHAIGVKGCLGGANACHRFAREGRPMVAIGEKVCHRSWGPGGMPLPMASLLY